MPRSSNSFLFPDINVWLALSYERHIHCSAAQAWFASLSDDVRLCFCRFTQLGLLRLLTTDAVMGGDRVLSQAEAWNAYDRLVEDDRIHIVEEPSTLEVRFRALSHQKRPAPKDWADFYLLAFAEAAGMKLVTFDQALRSRARHVLLLPT
jgi:hypothetical protein